ncbi:MAG: SpoVA/SpoVAEb family sporulation membrane protein [Oscillospiraceae bacterium]|nr:SpoVA/SpoVAEb family sporulation membrane protein [Oscillospiraceae bacterium]
MENLTDHAYGEMVKKASPPSKSFRDIPLAFLIGGGICTLGHFFISQYERWGVSEEIASPAGLITLIFLAVLLTGLGVYDKMAKVGGGGSLVPITGFANAVAAPALEFKSEGMILGLGAKMFLIVGPVIVYGVASGVIYGLILYLFKLY